MAIPYCTGSGLGPDADHPDRYDPYIPTGTNEEKCQGFLNAIAEVGKYVKLTSMIDFSTHPVYKTGFTEPIDFKCISLTADLDANGLPQYGVSGLIFKTNEADAFHKSCMFGFQNHYNSSSNTYDYEEINIHGIKFVNFLVSNYGYSGSASDGYLRLFGVKGAEGYATSQNFSNCAFSGIVKLRTNYFAIAGSAFKSVQYDDCSVYLTFQQPNGSYLVSDNQSSNNTTGSWSPFSNMHRCCVVVTSLKCGGCLEMPDCSDSTFYFNKLVFNEYKDSGGTGYENFNGLFCTLFGQPASGVSGNVIIAKISRTVGLSIKIVFTCLSPSSVVAVTDLDGNTLDSSLWGKYYDSTITDFASGDVGAYTPDDLKDVNKLVECGFIP